MVGWRDRLAMMSGGAPARYVPPPTQSVPRQSSASERPPKKKRNYEKRKNVREVTTMEQSGPYPGRPDIRRILAASDNEPVEELDAPYFEVRPDRLRLRHQPMSRNRNS